MGERIDELVERLSQHPANVRYKDLCRVCDHFFGRPRRTRGSHRMYKTPWEGEPRINIQNEHGCAKVYQVKQVAAALEKLILENKNG